MTDYPQLKQHINQQTVTQLAELFHTVQPSFSVDDFVTTATQGLELLGLKERVQHVVLALATELPQDFEKAADILEQLVAIWPQQPQRYWSSYLAWPVIDYVAVFGLDYPQRALMTLEKLTVLFTAEFAIRPFLLNHFEVTYQQMLRWTEHDNEHVRRLASEGIRPRLPWAKQLLALKKDPAPLWPILDKLKADDSLYVRRSVANNLNDISKDHPDLVVAVCREWSKTANAQTKWVMKHGLRTLVKTGHKAVYPLLGHSSQVRLTQAELTADKYVLKLGESLGLKLKLKLSTMGSASLIVDYRIGYVKAGGQLGTKVFKWKNVQIQTGMELTLTKRHGFKSVSSRQLYPGIHSIECLINGDAVARIEVELQI